MTDCREKKEKREKKKKWEKKGCTLERRTFRSLNAHLNVLLCSIFVWRKFRNDDKFWHKYCNKREKNVLLKRAIERAKSALNLANIFAFFFTFFFILIFTLAVKYFSQKRIKVTRKIANERRLRHLENITICKTKGGKILFSVDIHLECRCQLWRRNNKVDMWLMKWFFCAIRARFTCEKVDKDSCEVIRWVCSKS